MSSKILGNVWDACAAHDVKGAKLVIMARLADYSNDDGVCYPSVETICRQLGLGESTVRTAIAELESAGWLRRESRRKGNRNTSNLYHLNADRLEALARAEKDKVAALKQQRRANGFHPSDSEPSKSEPSDSGRSSGFHPSDSDKKSVFTRQNLTPDPQVLKPDPQVKDHEPQEVRAKRQKKSSFDPAGLKPENVSAEIWLDWIKFRREKRQPLTETTCAYQAKQLAGHQNADEVIRRSIAGGWQGLFPERVPNKPAISLAENEALTASQPPAVSWCTPSGDGTAEVFINQAAIERMKRGGYRQ
ncbi:helix-turn-helix domain-containing protein [Salmonella enterica]|uniref:helix-turn-helix domain-containing protein n=1 Tax=Salmonella enterica TaxID=28901 RepID=UPI0006D4C0FC|nr:helix-turn-helix domain-containing protein [Salmonella enterica]EAA3032894.1 helix-turn-helix domain-containing protein [Salmonella enterica subsp. enterica serovar Kisangani]EAA5679856.1 helix-turn-helix domain-containing protein [Salmonella enterica subsp. enterica]EBH8124723.1 helix-turn-helix domain-containing protein [Salmonella enterica subsp. enterica serovar Typhimurium str. UK-1]ECU9103655.1 helix-turn-helix domain-containing protein [Salmonella enterica subsp. enterica serovar Muen